MMDDRSILVRNPTKKSDLLANGVKRLQSDSVMGILYLLDCPLLNPMFVWVVMSFSLVSILLNAVRLERFKPQLKI